MTGSLGPTALACELDVGMNSQCPATQESWTSPLEAALSWLTCIISVGEIKARSSQKRRPALEAKMEHGRTPSMPPNCVLQEADSVHCVHLKC